MVARSKNDPIRVAVARLPDSVVNGATTQTRRDALDDNRDEGNASTVLVEASVFATFISFSVCVCV